MPAPRLKTRWRDPAGQEMATEVVNRINRGESLDDLPLGEHEGRADLRYFWLGSISGLEVTHRWANQTHNPVIVGAQLRDLDLSSSVTPLCLVESQVTNCVFDRVQWRSWLVQSSSISDSRFFRANLADSMLDVGNGFHTRANTPTRFVDCDFTSTKTGTSLLWGHARFERCLFDHTRFAQSSGWAVEFEQASFVDCTFKGDYKGLSFGNVASDLDKSVRPRLERVDFRDATLWFADFGSRDNSSCLFPENEQHVVVRHWPCVADRLIETDATPRGFSAVWLRRGRGWSAVEVFHIDDLRDAADGDPSDLIACIRQTEAECAAAPATAPARRRFWRR